MSISPEPRRIGISLGNIGALHDGLGEFSWQIGQRIAAAAPQWRERHGIEFDAYFAAERERLRELARDGLVASTRSRVAATARGRLLLRHIAMCFDAYLAKPVTVAALKDLLMWFGSQP